MPTWGYEYEDQSERWRQAEAQVRAKFPALIKGSSGWDRAVRNRINRLRG